LIHLTEYRQQQVPRLPDPVNTAINALTKSSVRTNRSGPGRAIEPNWVILNKILALVLYHSYDQQSIKKKDRRPVAGRRPF